MMPQGKRLASALAAFACALLAFANQCAAQNFPSRPIRFVVPSAPGSAADAMARTLGKKVSDALGQQVLVENHSGGGGIVAAETVARAPADGHTIFVSSVPYLAINPHLFPKLSYDPFRDFAPICIAVTSQLLLVVNASLPVRSMQEFLAYAKSHPRLFFGTPGISSQHHLAMQLFRRQTGLDLVEVPYKGVAQQTVALLANEVAVVLSSYPSVQPHVKAGKLRVLATAQGKRYGLMPDLPTIAESGLPGYEISTEIGFVAPTGTPRRVIDRLNGEIVKALKAPEVAQQLVAIGMDPIGSTPEQYAESIRANYELYRKIVKMSGARAGN